MRKDEIVDRLAGTLTSPLERGQRRRLVLAREAEGWRLGYAVPGAGDLGHVWDAGGWLSREGEGADQDLCTWVDLNEAGAVALEIRAVVLAIVGQDHADRLAVVLEDRRPTAIVV